MKFDIKRITNNKFFHIGILLFIICMVIFAVWITSVKYEVEGETNMPYILSKISIISSTQGNDKEEKVEGNQWNFTIDQDNDIYLYVDKNPEYSEAEKKETIKEINIDNIEVSKENEKGTLKIFRPDIENPNTIFSNLEENIVKDLKYEGAEKADMKEMKITNQGGIMAFRCSNCDIANYVANDEKINHNELLKKANISLEELKINIKFDISIKLDSGKIYKALIPLELPLEDVIENGTASKEFTDMSKYVFKRIKE